MASANPPIITAVTPARVWRVTLKTLHLLWLTDRGSLILLTSAGILGSLTILPVLYLDKLFIDTLVDNIGSTSISAAIRFLALLVFFRFLVGTLRSFLDQAEGYLNDHLRRVFQDKLQLLVAQKFAQVPVSDLETPEFQDRYRKIERDSLPKTYLLIDNITQIPSNLAGVLAVTALLAFSYPLIFLISLVLMLPIILIDQSTIKGRYRLIDRLEPINRILSWLYFYLLRPHGYLEQRLLNATKYLSDRFAQLSLTYNLTWSKFQKNQYVKKTIATLPYNVFSYASELYFAFLALASAISVGTAQAMIRAMASLRSELRTLIQNILDFYENYVYISDLIWFLELPPPSSGPVSLTAGSRLTAGIEFKHVWFKYPGTDNWILQDVSFVIPPRQKVAIIGENGAGKTTLIKLICNFYSPSRGEITLNGRPISDYDLSSLLKNIAVFFQDMETYQFSARESIGLGNLNYIHDLDRIRAAAQQTDIDDWIQSLPLKYENPLSRDMERGVIPSAGQWQRIGLARTLIKQSPIIILDEPTSNVDPKAEEEIFKNVLRLGKDKILIFISHRFSTVRKADHIIVLDKHRVVEQGNHSQLIKQAGLYARLFKLQAQNYR